ncbi:hypothetical protein [Curtobacterium sp. MCSS17_015]|uniref:hypothetical protein n=1 Tax=Curtobacterium sp. MCSS17_015 TaxID=2175666 RepID=UPI000DA795A1|nr:hypothetical protein [Curtobacterium sp. MCSS17_015]WIB25324.1 hypothetical protein DEJ18_09630 [Curtobacterium sp. MCSS17_015]
MSRLHHLMVIFGLLVTSLVAVPSVPAQAAVGDATAADAPASGRYSPVRATRAFSGAVGTTWKRVTVAGTKGVPRNAVAVVLTVGVASPTRAGGVQVAAAGTDSALSAQSFRAGQGIANTATVRLSGGAVQVRVTAGKATAFLDVAGFYGAGGSSTFTPLDPARVFSGTRIGTAPVTVPLAGRGGVPTTATAVAVNVTVERQTSAGSVRLSTAGQDPAVTTQVFERATPVSNSAVVALARGAAQVRTTKGTATVSVDVTGYYATTGTGYVFTPMDPVRVLSTTASSAPRTIRVTGVGGVPGVAAAVVATTTVTAPTATGTVRVTAAGRDTPLATQRHAQGQSISSTVMPLLVDGSAVDRRLQVRVTTGSATTSVDVSGYFTAPAAGSGVGADLSWPQCRTAPSTWPSDQAFGIVGVNGGRATTTNPCLARQLAWAATSRGGTTQPTTQLYVNTANPGRAFADDPTLARASWPTTNRDPDGTAVAVPLRYGVCSGGVAGLSSLACSYVYGWNRAHEDVHDRGVPSGPYRWWLDAETDGSWQSSQALNRATLEGMTDMFRSTGASVGVYSSPGEWAQLMGSVPASSQLYTLPTWRAIGPSTLATAQTACSATPFTAGGRTELVQYVEGGFDRVVSCASP